MKPEPPDANFSLPTSWIVQPEHAGVRLDAFLRRCLPHVSLAQLKRAFAENAFRVGNQRGKKGYRVRAGDEVTFVGAKDLLATAPLPGRWSNVRVVYADEALLVVDKPAGMPTHGFSGRETGALTNQLLAAYPELSSVGKSPWETGLVNRLDRETSGLVVVARAPDAFNELRAQFRRNQVQKKYWAVVHGVTSDAGVIDKPIFHDAKNRRKMKTVVTAARERGMKKWPAITRYRSLGHSKGFTLVEVEIHSGVTHQIRVHFAAQGNPLLGDSLYGGKQMPARARHFLHACYLACRHPRSGAPMAWESPMPEDLSLILEELGLRFSWRSP